MSMKNIVLVGALDTKGHEIAFVRDELRRRGLGTTVIDDGVLGQPQITADVSRETVAEAGGKSLKELVEEARQGSDRSETIALMAEGVSKVVQRLHAEGKLDAIFSLGGSMGSVMGVKAMKALPVGVPKLMLTTHLYQHMLGDSDMTIMLSPTDIMGLDPIATRTLAQAAGAIAGMVEAPPLVKTRPLVAITALGVTTPGVMALQAELQARGYDTVVFHGNSEFMEQATADGTIDGIIDFTPAELPRAVLGSDVPARLERLETAGLVGAPQVLVPGSLDMLVLRVAREQVPERFRDRKLYMHNPYVTAVRTSKEDMRRLAVVVADKANRARGPVAAVFPLQGFSEIDRNGKAFHEPETDRVFVSELKRALKPSIPVYEFEYHINDRRFAAEVARIFDEISQGGRK